MRPWTADGVRRFARAWLSLQWGHGLAAVDGGSRCRGRAWRRASMGPRPCGRGRLRRRDRCCAACELQWGHGLAAVDGGKCGRHVRAALELQWGHGLAAVDGHNRGARRLALCRASMGPRPCGRGRADPPDAPSMPGTWLQWGHGLAAVDGPSGAGHEHKQRKLQWGHGLAAVDGSHGLWLWLSDEPASMGPRPCGRGRRGGAGAVPAPPTCFNGATALRPWTEWESAPAARVQNGFNGATALRPWTVEGGGGPVAGCWASMGPRPCGRGR